MKNIDINVNSNFFSLKHYFIKSLHKIDYDNFIQNQFFEFK